MFYANKEKREELCKLSTKVFGKRYKWRYFVNERGYTIDSIELQMKALEVEIDKQLEAAKDAGQATTKTPVFKRPNRETRRRYGIR